MEKLTEIEQQRIIPIEKCKDTHAKFHLTFKFVPTGEELSDFESSQNSEIKPKK